MLSALPADARVARRMAFTLLLFEGLGMAAAVAFGHVVDLPWFVAVPLLLAGYVIGRRVGRKALLTWGNPLIT